MPKFHSFLLLSLINRFGKENSQFTKNIRETQNWSYQKLFCMIFSNFCFLCFLVWKSAFLWKGCLMSWKFAWSHESLQNGIVLVNWTWLTVLERKTPNSPKVYAKHNIGLTKIVLHDFEQLLLFCFLVWKSAFCHEKGAWCHEKICVKSGKSPKCYCFGKLNLTNRFGKENSQFTKNIRETQNWSYHKLFCMILSNFFLCFLVWKSAFCYEKGAWWHENFLEVMKVSKILLFW